MAGDGDPSDVPANGTADDPGGDKAMIRFLLRHCAAGVLIGWGILAAILVTDTANMATLLTGAGPSGADIAWVPAALLAFGFAITFGSLAMGTAVFMLPSGRDRPRPPRKGIAGFFAPPLRPVAIRNRDVRRR